MPKRLPERKCVGCGALKPKNELARIVLSPEGEFSVDPTGKAPGRGAYICRNKDCLRRAEKNRGLEKSFRRSISHLVYEKLGRLIDE